MNNACKRRNIKMYVGKEHSQNEVREASDSRLHYGVDRSNVAKATAPGWPEAEKELAHFSMKVGRYWRLQADAPFCGRYPEVTLDELVEACLYIHGQSPLGASNRPKSGAMIVARQTPACWALYNLGYTGDVAYVVVDEDLGEVWTIHINSAVSVNCAIKGDVEGVKELLDQIKSASKVALIEVKESEASVVNVL